MTVKDLMESLAQFPMDMEVMARDVVAYRELCGPYRIEITIDDSDNHYNCEGRIDEEIVVL